jgi:hypothetical protein
MASFSTLASGARQLVVHDPFETTRCSGSRLPVVDAVDHGLVGPLGRGRHQHPLGAARQMHGGLVAVIELAGAFQHHIDAVQSSSSGL